MDIDHQFPEYSEGLIPPESLMNELYFHSPHVKDQHALLELLAQGVPLLGLVGRATLSKGTALHRGPYFVFQIPSSYQERYLESPGGSSTQYEEWAHGNKQTSALGETVPAQFHDYALAWTQSIQNGNIPIEDIRSLPAKFLVAVIEVKGKEYDQSKGLVRPKGISGNSFVQGITLENINTAMNLYVDQYSPF